MAKRKKLRKEVYYVLIGIIILIIGIIFIKDKYQEYKYKQTYEYKLIEHGYQEDEAKDILNAFSNENEIDFFLDNEVNLNYLNITKEKYYLKKNFNDYIEYMNNNKKLDLSTVVRNINIHLDQEFYSTNYKTNTTLDTSMLVNKYYLLDENYTPDDLVSVSTKYAWGDAGSQKVRQVAYDAFLDMWNAANDEGYYLMINSSYRSYQDQESIYNNYKSSQGQKYADSIAARPGASEHQTGLTMDIFSKTNTNKNTFAESETAAWLANNSYKYGFILRYPQDKENVTGYSYEAWHFRYVGVNIATYIYQNNITFEEYYAYFIEK